MHITLETDYALRIVDCLARNHIRMGAKLLSEQACVTLRFSLKILRKLVSSGIVRSYKGTQGGYEIAKPLNEISLHDVLETIEGPFVFNRCLFDEFECTHCEDKNCRYYDVFSEISAEVRDRLRAVTIAEILRTDEEKSPSIRGLRWEPELRMTR